MSVRNSLEKLLPFKTGEFHVTDSADFISTLCPNELGAFEAWIGLFERCGGFKHRNFDAFYLYEFFMDGKTPVEVIGINKTFEIKQHEWSDCGLVFNRLDVDCNIHFHSTDVDCEIFINKTDAIAIAKHFKLKAEDLK